MSGPSSSSVLSPGSPLPSSLRGKEGEGSSASSAQASSQENKIAELVVERLKTEGMEFNDESQCDKLFSHLNKTCYDQFKKQHENDFNKNIDRKVVCVLIGIQVFTYANALGLSSGAAWKGAAFSVTPLFIKAICFISKQKADRDFHNSNQPGVDENQRKNLQASAKDRYDFAASIEAKGNRIEIPVWSLFIPLMNFSIIGALLSNAGKERTVTQLLTHGGALIHAGLGVWSITQAVDAFCDKGYETSYLYPV